MSRGARGRHDGIRLRLGLTLAAALAPVLVLSGLQSALIFNRDAADKRAELVGAARQAANGIRANLGETASLLRGIAATTASYQCVERLEDLKSRMPSFLNLVRLNAQGWVTCAATPVSNDQAQGARQGLRDLRRGRSLSVRASFSGGDGRPIVLIGVPESVEDGRAGGSMTAVISAAALASSGAGRAAPADSEVAITDKDGRFVASATPARFPRDPSAALHWARGRAGVIWLGADRTGESRLFAAAPLADDLDVVLSAPSEGLISWARLNPLSAFVLPILAFLVALASVALVAERGVVRWILYLRRVAQLYAGGRYGVRPTKAEAAPAEIRELAAALGHMAETLMARDVALRDNIAAKDKMMREIHHRVKNNLQVISSLLNLQQRSLSDDRARAAIRDTRQRILAMSLIYRALYEGPDLGHVNLADFVNELVAQLLTENRDLPSQTDVRTAPLNIEPDRLAPLALFIVEAVGNVARGGHSESERPLGIRFDRSAERGELLISQGAPPAEERDLGATLMKVFARQLGGDVSYPPNPTGGHDARLVFPLHVT